MNTTKMSRAPGGGRPTPLMRAFYKVRYHVHQLRDRVREGTFPLTVSWISGPRTVPASREDLVVVCTVRNGALYLPEFMRHYRELGAKHMVFMDNGSTDGTIDLAKGHGDVTVFRTAAPFKIYKEIMKRWLLKRFGRSNWVLCVDIDELFDYPFRRDCNLQAFLRYLNGRGFTAVVAQMLDMFPEGAITSSSVEEWRREHRYYSLRHLEREPYVSFYGNSNVAPAVEIDIMYGGIRGSAFDARVLLTKHPLLFPSAGIAYLHPHHVSGARVADVSAVLLHYKFVGDFMNFVKVAVKEESYSTNSREYKKYLEVLKESPDLRLHSQEALEFDSTERLLEENFLIASSTYRSVAAGRNAAGADQRTAADPQ
jgi:glycosyl transferase family 2